MKSSLQDEIADLEKRLDIKERELTLLRNIYQQALTVTKYAPILIMVVDTDGNITLATGAGLKDLEQISNSFETRSIYQVFNGYSEAIEGFRISLEGNKTDFILRIVKEDNITLLDFHVNPIFENDEQTGVIATANNITQLFNIQQRFIESESKYSTIINSAPFGILVIHNVNCKYANPSFLEMFGYEPEFDITDKSSLDFLIPSMRNEMNRRSISRQRGGMEPSSYEITALRKDNSIFPAQVFGNRIIFDNKPSVMLFFIDLTDIKELRQEKEKLHEQLLLAQKYESLGIVSSAVAHDFNNLLVGIMGNASLLQLDLVPNSPQAVLLKEIQKIAMNAANLTKQMISYTSPTSNKVDDCDLTSVVKEITKLLSISISHSIIIEYELKEPLLKINADITQIQQLILNLVISASDSIGENNGKILIKTDHGDEGVSLTVIDNGASIKEEDYGKIFDPTTDVRGLGLSVVKGIVKTHHGEIRFHSDEEGNKFTILFPISKVGEEEKDKPAGKGELPKGKVLFCDDDARVREVGEKMLDYLEFEVILACDGQEALNALETNEDIILIILDLSMPVLSGRKALDQIQEMSKKIPIIISSGHFEAIDEFEGRQNIEFLHKPYTLNRFKETIAKLF